MLPIILIHGFPFDATMWEKQARFLREKGRKVITPDLPGFGGTPAWPREKTSIEAYAALVHEVIQMQGGDGGGRAIVGGFSMGGYILLSLLRDYPDSVAAAMLIDTRADPDKPEAKANRLQQIEEIQKHGTAGVFDAMLPKVLSKRPLPVVKDQARSLMERQSAAGGEGAANALWAMSRRRDQTDLLPELKMPMLIVVGADDSITPPSVALAMQSHMPHAMVVQIVSAGHLSPVEQPDAVNAAIDTFLATVK